MKSRADERASDAFDDEVEDQRLDGDVQGGGWFVADQEGWVVGQGDGQDDSLPLAAGELVRVGAQQRRRGVGRGRGGRLAAARAARRRRTGCGG